jgi:hypothetical protein
MRPECQKWTSELKGRGVSVWAVRLIRASSTMGVRAGLFADELAEKSG